MSDDKKEFKYTYVGKVVVRDGKTDDGEEFQYMSLQLGNRKYGPKHDKAGELIPPIKLTKEQEKNLLDLILTKDLYVFSPKEGAPSFIKKYVAVRTEDLKGGAKKESKQRDENDDF